MGTLTYYDLLWPCPDKNIDTKQSDALHLWHTSNLSDFDHSYGDTDDTLLSSQYIGSISSDE